jgi:hypothetical protein
MVSSSYFEGDEYDNGNADCRKEVVLNRFLLRIGIILPALLLFMELIKGKQVRPGRLDLIAMIHTPYKVVLARF